MTWYPVWGLFGFAAGMLGVLVLSKMLPRLLAGETVAALVIGLKLFWHLIPLTIAALVSAQALLWTAGGDLAALFVSTALIYIRKRRGSRGD